MWSNGSYTYLPPLPPSPDQQLSFSQAINDSGLVVGSGSSEVNGVWTSYYYVPDGANTVELLTPAGAPPNTGPRAINDADWIVGEAMNAGFGVNRSARWDANGNFVDLGGLSPNPAFSSFSWALSSSRAGHRVVGESRFDLDNVNATTAAFHAFRTQPSTAPVAVIDTDDLGNMLASETSLSGCRAINNLSEIIGYSSFSATEHRASYKDGNSGKNKGWRTLGVLSGGSGAGLSSLALALNDSGLAVGWSRSSTGGHAQTKSGRAGIVNREKVFQILGRYRDFPCRPMVLA